MLKIVNPCRSFGDNSTTSEAFNKNKRGLNMKKEPALKVHKGLD